MKDVSAMTGEAILQEIEKVQQSNENFHYYKCGGKCPEALKEGKVNGLRVNDYLWYRPGPFAEFGCPCAVCRTRVVNNSIYCNGANLCMYWVQNLACGAPMLHASETSRPLPKPNLQRLQRNDRAVISDRSTLSSQRTWPRELLGKFGVQDIDLMWSVL